jgi:hypothetical protein
MTLNGATDVKINTKLDREEKRLPKWSKVNYCFHIVQSEIERERGSSDYLKSFFMLNTVPI